MEELLARLRAELDHFVQESAARVLELQQRTERAEARLKVLEVRISRAILVLSELDAPFHPVLGGVTGSDAGD